MATLGASIKSGLAFILPKGKSKPQGTSQPNTYDPNATTSDIALPAYRDHLTDLFQTRQSQDSRALIKDLFKHDPDVSAALNAFLTAANTPMWYVVKDSKGVISRPGHQALEQVLLSLGTRFDYTQPAGFYLQRSWRSICEEMRYMVLLRGGIGTELVLNKVGLPVELRTVDLGTITWREKAPNVYLPIQKPTHAAAGQSEISMDIATFFVSFFHQDPTEIYSYSPFVSAINTIAARQQIVNDLYRIMQMTGYPRIDVTMMEEVVRKNAPADAQTDPEKLRLFMQARRNEIQTAIANLRPDQAIVHTDSISIGIVNEKSAGMTLDIQPIIDVLNSQNQAGLKVVASTLGRGTSGVNTASVEARVFALNAQAINGPVADILSQALTLCLRLQGVDAVVEVGFEDIELRPATELEPHLQIKQNRLMQLLSYGLIGDDEFHLELFNKIRPDSIPEMSGTMFFDPPKATGSDAASAKADALSGASNQPNSQERASSPKDSNKAKDKQNPK